jgi:hypothetical protein
MEYETAAGTSPRALAVAAVTSLPSRSRDRSEAFLETSVTHARRPVSKLSLVRFGDPEPVLAKHVCFHRSEKRRREKRHSHAPLERPRYGDARRVVQVAVG